MKKYLSIERLKEGGDYTNTDCFEIGDIISIQEKVDGANSSIAYIDGEFKCFSHNNELTPSSDLRGFYNFVQNELTDYQKMFFKVHPNWICFGEWLVSHTVKYDKEAYNKWYLFSIWDTAEEIYLRPEIVREVGENFGFDMPNELYHGEFISWEHCKSFMNSPSLGDTQEGIVVTNCDTIMDKENRKPFIIKIVNKQFREIQKSNHIKKVIAPNEQIEKENAEKLLSTVITRQRVEKIILKCKDEGIFPAIIMPTDMGLIAKALPNLVYQDIVKEEPEILKEAGKYSNKICNNLTMQLARDIIL